MPQSAPPWRVLEEPPLPGAPGLTPEPGAARAPAATPGGAGGGRAAQREPTVQRSLPLPSPWLVAALAAAALLLVVAFVLAAGSQRGMVEVSAVSGSGRPAGSGGAGNPSGAGPAATAETIVVEVAGAVVRPGLYTLPKGSRAGDAIAAAGGYGPRVDAQLASRDLNLAATLRDGERVRVPSRDDQAGGTSAPAIAGTGAGGAAGGAGSTAGRPGGLLDLNRATGAELEALPGIGPATAAKIIAARAERPFAALDDLVDRKLVSTKVLEAIRGLVTVG